MTTQEDAAPSHWSAVGVEREPRREESLDRNAGLQAGKRRADAEVETPTEREVGREAGRHDKGGTSMRVVEPTGSSVEHGATDGDQADPRRLTGPRQRESCLRRLGG